MTNQIVAFKFDKQDVRVFETDGAPWFVARDVAAALGYAEPHKAVAQHCDDAKSLKDIDGAIHPIQQNQALSELDPKTKLIQEPDVYALIFGSKLESAKRFKRWVVEEVLPSIRKTGAYVAPTMPVSPIQQANATIREWLDTASMFGAPKHLALQEGTKDVLVRLGVDFTPLLLASSYNDAIPDEDVYLEPTDLGLRLGYGPGRQAGVELNRALAVIGWQTKCATGWEPTDTGRAFCQRHAWAANGKTGYNWKWSLIAVRNALTEPAHS